MTTEKVTDFELKQVIQKTVGVNENVFFDIKSGFAYRLASELSVTRAELNRIKSFRDLSQSTGERESDEELRGRLEEFKTNFHLRTMYAQVIPMMEEILELRAENKKLHEILESE